MIELQLEKKDLLQEILNNYREINLLYKFSGNLSSMADFDHLLKSAILEIKSIVDADTYSLQLLNKENSELQTKAYLGNLCTSTNQSHPDKVLARLVVKSGCPEIVNDTKQKQKIKDCSCDINSILGIPLKAKEEMYGVIILTSHKENYFKARDIKLILSLASQIAVTIENTYLQRSNWEQKRQLALRRILKEDVEREYKELVGMTGYLKNKVPPDPVPYLIYGEYGNGKKLLAKKIHNDSNRKNKPFIIVDCAQLSTNVLGHKLLFGSGNQYEPKKTENDFSYLELAEGGTIFLKNFDRLSKDLGEKLFKYITPSDNGDNVKLAIYNVRIAAESIVPVGKKAETGDFDANLYDLFSKNIITIPPLRERKRDIITLTEYFIKEYSRSLGKNIKGVDDKCHEKLLGYHYRLGNIKELREIIERACILTESDVITSEYLFLGTPSSSSKVSYNLFNIQFFYNLVKKGIFPRAFIYISSIFVALIFYFAFFTGNNSGTNPATFLSWTLWWPFYIISFFFLSRFWCSICPINEYGIILRKIKFFNLKVTDFIKNNSHYFVTFGFLTIIWAEEYFEMSSSAFKTGMILLIIVSCAAITNIIFQRNTWCRYICPLGWFGGTLSLTSILELRSNPDICGNKCKTHDCYKGNEKIEGCPMFLHPQFIDNNQLCKLCLRCVRLCPNNSPKLNLRLPGRDITDTLNLGEKTSLLIPCLLSAPLSITIAKNITAHNTFLNFSLIFWTLPFILGFLIWLLNFIFYGSDKKNGFQNFFNILNFYIPIALAANLAIQLKFIPILAKINISGTLIGLINTKNIFNLSFLDFSQINIILGGFFLSFFLMTVHYFKNKSKKEKQPVLFYLTHQSFMFIYCLLFFYFLFYY
ncbi:sigma 54-interacting transcriptional regulator [Candidatus Desantisbacteria bacterium]|nr:sigma 54-interacting transcriptional regulator [Candidatus Desantisbacteria bacterium]